jgi:methyl-accepting chemotaxis protein
MNISIKQKIIINAICISWFSIVVAGGLILWRMEKLGTVFLEKVEEQRLTNIRYFKSQQIVNYFKQLSDNILILSKNQSTIAAVQEFSKAFSKYLPEYKYLTTGYQRSVIDNYVNLFIEQYKIYNAGKNINSYDILNLMTEEGFALQYKYIFDNPYPISQKYRLNATNDGTDYSVVHEKYHQTMLSFKEHFGFYDVFLIDQQGKIVYTVNKEIDFTASLLNGPYAGSGLSKVFQQVMNAEKDNFIAITDFAPYLSFYDNQAAFIGTSIVDGVGNRAGALVAQLSVDVLNKLMMSENKDLQKIGLGKSVNYVIVGSDYKLRTDNRFFLENKEVFLDKLKTTGVVQNVIDLIRAKDSCIGLLTTNTAAVKNALAGQDGFIPYVDYRKIPVVGSFAPLQIPGLNWVIVVKIDQEEAFQWINILKKKILLDVILVAIFIAIIGVFLGVITTSSIVQSIYKITEELNSIAKSKDLTRRLDPSQGSEFIIMINAVNNFIASVQQAFQNIQGSVMGKFKNNTKEPEDIKKDIFDLVEQVEDLSKEFKIIEDQNDRIKYW